MYKRILTLVLALVMLWMFAACQKQENNESASVTTIGETTEVTTAPTYPGLVYTPEGNDGDLDEISGEVLANATESSAQYEAESTQPIETVAQEGTTASTETGKDTAEKIPELSVTLSEYEKYNAMSGPEQQAFMESFGSIPEFFEWYNSAKAEYEAANPPIIIDGDEINAEDIIGK